MNESTLFSRLLADLSRGDAASWVALVGLLLSVAHWVYTFILERQNLKVSILSGATSDDTMYALMMFENKSRLPVAITQISLIQGEKWTNCRPYPKEVIRAFPTRDCQHPSRMVYSEQIPIQLAGLSSRSCIVLFEDIPEAPPQTSTHLSFQISTNRRKPLKTQLELPPEWGIPMNKP